MTTQSKYKANIVIKVLPDPSRTPRETIMLHTHTVRLSHRLILFPSMALVFAIGLAGCLELGENDPASTPGEPSEDETTPINETPAQPLVFNGSATLSTPAHGAFCVHEGIDGETHTIEKNVDDWHFQVEPADSFTIYWHSDAGYLEGGESSGSVPEDASLAEVCYIQGIGPAEYTLTLDPPPATESDKAATTT